ncbi:protein transport protein SEC24-like [Salvia hispanica]|uniref:protein transport protein SEC24-like n=1 Tax=Salvia hispanica TaxID=49212 RepID=UPI00200971F3|nr:protein transport protein SEC24-like [Salvia hispanica]
MVEVNLRSWSEILQASEGLQLNSTAATLEHILAMFARLETRLVAHECRVAATLPPLQHEPDPSDATTFQQPHAAQLPRQYLQQQQPYQLPAPPPDALPWQQLQQPEMEDWRWQQHQPHTQPVQTRRPTSWDPPDYCQQSGFMPYDQYPMPYHHWEKNQPPLTPPCGWDPPAQ